MKTTRNLSLLCLLLFSLSAEALTGWNLSKAGDTLRYVPRDLPSGKRFEYRVYGPFDPGDADLKSWFSDQALAIQETLGKPLEPWVVEPDNQKWSIGNSFKESGCQNSGSWKRHIVFHDDGTFELDAFSMQSNGMMGGGSMTPDGSTVPLITTAAGSDKSGSSSATSVSGSHVGGGGWSKRRDGSKNTGRYEINEYSVTLTHDNGHKHTELLYYEKRKGEYNLVYGNDLYWLEIDKRRRNKCPRACPERA